MQIALFQAKKSLARKEVPVGAVIVDEKGIVAVAQNQIEEDQCQLGHAEALAIKKACKIKGSWRLQDCQIFVTLEPCLMCFGLIRMSRIKKIIYGAPSKLFGYSNFIDQLEQTRNLSIKSSLKQDDSTAMLKEFFGQVRLFERKVYEKRT